MKRKKDQRTLDTFFMPKIVPGNSSDATSSPATPATPATLGINNINFYKYYIMFLMLDCTFD